MTVDISHDISQAQCALFLQNAFGENAAKDFHVDLRNNLGGAINSVFRIIDNSNNETKAMLRIRTGEPFFGYEKGVVKESLIANIVKNPKQNNIAEIIKARLKHEAAKNIQFPQSSNILYYEDNSVFGVPASILEYIEGPALIQTDDLEHYKKFGEKLAHLHSISFPNFAHSLLNIDETIDFDKKYASQITHLLSQAHYLSVKEKEKITTLSTLIHTTAAQPVLCHGDFHGYNAIVHNNDVCLIDWDNAVIDTPELDFAKVYYWTELNAEGVLGHNTDKFYAIIDGYMRVSSRKPDQYLIRMMALQWLLRVGNFEYSLQTTGKKNKGHFPALESYYIPAIQNLLSELD